MTNEINNLGLTYFSQGKYDEAIVRYERALRIFEKMFEVNHINTIVTINNLDMMYDSKGKYDEAIADYERSLRIKEKAFEENHINTIATINNLENTYDSQDKYDKTIAQYKRALRIYEKTFEVNHINTIDSINNLEITYSRQNKYDDAIIQYKRILRIFEIKILFHPNTTQTHANIVMILLHQFVVDERFKMLENAIEHFRLNVLAISDQDSRMVSWIENLRRLMPLLRILNREGEEDQTMSLEVRNLSCRFLILSNRQYSSVN